MSRNLWLLLALAVPAMTSGCAASQDAPIVLACEVSGVSAAKVESFAAMVCDQAAAQLRELSGTSVSIASPQDIMPGMSSSWLRLDVAITSQYSASAKASWGGGDTPPGQGPQVEAGIDDASLDENTAAMLVRTLLNVTPYGVARD